MAPRVASPGQPGRWSGTSSRSIGLERPGNKNLRRRFFVEAFQGGRAVLKGEQAEHLGRVLRARTGQLYELSDQSSVWLGRVAAVKRDAIEFDLLERVPVEQPRLEISLLLSLIKFPRFEWCLEKATELGVTEVIPIIAGRSQKGLADAARKRLGRWQKILLESAEQSRQLRIPRLATPAGVERALREASAPLKLFLSESPEAKPLKEVLAGREARSAAVAIGPEGGWTDAEVSVARGAGFLEAALGPAILRTETAVAAILAILVYESSR